MTIVMIMYKKMPLFSQQFIWPWMKVTLTDMPWKTTSVLTFMLVLMIVWENDATFEFLKIFSSALTTVTLDEGHRNWYNLKSRATKYFCTKFHDCTGNGIWENVNVFPVFPSAPVTVTLGEGHSNWYGLTGLATKTVVPRFRADDALQTVHTPRNPIGLVRTERVNVNYPISWKPGRIWQICFYIMQKDTESIRYEDAWQKLPPGLKTAQCPEVWSNCITVSQTKTVHITSNERSCQLQICVFNLRLRCTFHQWWVGYETTI